MEAQPDIEKYWLRRFEADAVLQRLLLCPRKGGGVPKLMAEALTHVLLGSSRFAKPDDELAILGFLGASENLSVVQQAVGIVSVQCDCQVGDAADLLAARAFADGTSLAELARQIVHGDLQFD